MANTIYAVKIEGKLNTSNKCAAYLRKALNCKNSLRQGHGGYTHGYVYIRDNDIGHRWGYFRQYNVDFLDNSYAASQNDVVILGTDKDYVGKI